MSKQSKIDYLNEVQEKLNGLLSTYAVHYQNLRSMHWNVTGPEFFLLHEKFEEEYLDAQTSVDEIAERILSLGGKPIGSFSVYLDKSVIAEFKSYESAEQSIGFLVESIDILLQSEEEVLEMASDAGDEGTVALMSDLIAKQEKTRWMFAATINKSYTSQK
ncbi:MAG: Dps family protein [Bacteroidales bacterium]